MDNKEAILARGRRRGRTFVNAFSWIFMSAGVLCVAVCVLITLRGGSFRKVAEPADALIVAMRGADSESYGTPEIEYTVDGRLYTAVLNVSVSTMHPGKHITVYYRKDDPHDVRYLDSNRWIAAILTFIGAVFMTVGVTFILLERKREKRRRLLLETGVRIEAEITDISEDRSKSMNGRHPIFVSCRYTSPDGRVYLFKSGSCWFDSFNIDPKRKVRVYLDRNDPSNYYVDTDSVIG